MLPNPFQDYSDVPELDDIQLYHVSDHVIKNQLNPWGREGRRLPVYDHKRTLIAFNHSDAKLPERLALACFGKKCLNDVHRITLADIANYGTPPLIMPSRQEIMKKHYNDPAEEEKHYNDPAEEEKDRKEQERLDKEYTRQVARIPKLCFLSFKEESDAAAFIAATRTDPDRPDLPPHLNENALAQMYPLTSANEFWGRIWKKELVCLAWARPLTTHDAAGIHVLPPAIVKMYFPGNLDPPPPEDYPTEDETIGMPEGYIADMTAQEAYKAGRHLLLYLLNLRNWNRVSVECWSNNPKESYHLLPSQLRLIQQKIEDGQFACDDALKGIDMIRERLETLNEADGVVGADDRANYSSFSFAPGWSHPILKPTWDPVQESVAMLDQVNLMQDRFSNAIDAIVTVLKTARDRNGPRMDG